MAKIVIDAGHGGRDVGAVGKRSTEANNMLQMALKMKPMLERNGHKVILTRSINVFLSLYQRSKISNDHKADVFISLHQNSASSSSATGFETFIFNGNVSNNTKRLQNNIHKSIIQVVPYRDRGMKRANFGVLRMTSAPSVLIEYGFINNPKEEKYMIDNIDKLAKATADGINAYFGIKTTSTNKGELTMSQYQELKEEIRLLQLKTKAPLLEKTQQKDMQKLLKYAFDSGVFHIDHSKKVSGMTQKEALDLMLSYVARSMTA